MAGIPKTGMAWPPSGGQIELPSGGSDGHVLTKASATDFDVAWEALAGGGGGGSTILSGTAPPTAGTGAAGDYYLDTDDLILYGPKAAASGTGQSVYTSQTPTGGNWALNNEAYGVNVASAFTFAKAGKITALRINRTSTSFAGYVLALWSSTGTKLAEVTVPTGGSTGWTTVTIPDVPITAGQVVRVSLTVASGSVVTLLRDGYPGGITNFDISMDEMGFLDYSSTPINPSGLNPSHYYIDPVFQVQSPVWPVALYGDGGGSTIMSGTTTPAAGTGAVGDYYLDTDDRILYGPKVNTAAGPDEYVTIAPMAAPLSSTGDMCGMKYRFAVAGQVTGIRVFVTAGAGVTVPEVYLYSGTGTLLASKDNATPLTANAWNNVIFTTPVTVSPGTTYIAAIWGGGVNIGRDNGIYAGQTSGNVIALADGVDGETATYSAVRDTCPLTDMGVASMGISPIFNTGGGNPWPVALKSVPPGGTTAQVLAKTDAADYSATWATAASANSSVILNGDIPPTNADGALGNYYLDRASRILYGPKMSVDPSTNMLTANQASVETDLTGFTVVAPSSIAKSSAYAAHGSSSLAATCSGPWVYPFRLTGNIPVIPNQQYTRMFSARVASGASKNIYIEWEWLNAALTTIGTGTGNLCSATTSWTQVSETRTAPSDAAYMVWKLMSGSNVVNGDIIYIDKLGLFPGIESVWSSPPGYAWPIALKSVPAGGTAAQVLAKTSATDYDATWAAAAAGSTILTGTATPAAGTGAVGDYYLDTDDRVLYGPKVTAATLSVHTSQTPVSATVGWNVELGVRITCAAAGFVTALRYYRVSDTTTTTRILNLWDVNTQAKLATATSSAESGSGWFSLPITPVAVTAGMQIAVSYSQQQSMTQATIAGVFAASGTIVNGSLTATRSYSGTTGTFPASTQNDDWYTDIVFQESISWPVALKSVPAGGTTSQVLAKTTATDYDATWSTPAAGGATGTAGGDLTGTYPNPQIATGVIVNADINASAAIAQSKIQNLTTDLAAKTAVLSGTATPTDAIGALGNYYLDTDDRILYGPKVSSGFLAPASAYTSQTSTNPGNITATSYGNDFIFAVAGQITGLRYYRDAGTTSGVRNLRVWNTTSQTLLGSGTSTGTSGTGWQTVTFGTPIAVVAGQAYRCSIGHTATAPVVRIANFASDIVNGNITMLKQGYEGLVSESAFPAGVYSNTYFVDVIFEAVGVIDPWPVALKSATSAMLSGTATPTGATGAAGDYYLDTDDRVLYGPKVALGSGAGQSVYTSQTPGDDGSSFLDPGGYAGDITCAFGGRITGLRFYRHASSSTTGRTLRLWHSDGTLLGTATTSGESGSGWKTAALAAPVTVTAGQTVRVGYNWAVADWVSRTINKTWPGSEITNLDLQLVKCYSSAFAPDVRPNTVTNNWVFADVVFDSHSDPWPVALKSPPPGGTTSQVLAKTSATDYDWNWATAAAGGGATPTRDTVSKTTASLAAGATETGTISLANAYRLYRVTTSAPAMVQLYTTTAKRDADLARPEGTEPTGDHGMMFEFVSDASLLAADLSPTVDGFDGKTTPDGVIPISITNKSGAAAAITVTLIWIRTE